MLGSHCVNILMTVINFAGALAQIAVWRVLVPHHALSR